MSQGYTRRGGGVYAAGSGVLSTDHCAGAEAGASVADARRLPTAAAYLVSASGRVGSASTRTWSLSLVRR